MEPTLTAYFNKDNIKYWLFGSMLHRVDGPAVIRPDGIDGLKDYHPDDGPMWIYLGDSTQYWAFGHQYNSLEDL